ncbi:hypothetical protein Nepgr_005918 [Nepenthes gracilis]|uniref:Uncharacterized protein n=1 Tax=Nepenthes gracilis TaxID=150966 RepID=A0AAD3XGU6_NEPGR|nr:hypothetical protein Nepgr_005918 [Nepenthes gracilis]
MEESKKRAAHEWTTDSSLKKPKPPAPSENTGHCDATITASANTALDDCEDIFSGWSMDDETIEELTKLLEPEQQSPAPFRVKFISYPYSAPLIYESPASSSYVTINGNEESCGSSFSDSASSFMASIDMGSFNIVQYPPVVFGYKPNHWKYDEASAAEGGAWSSDDKIARGWMVDGSATGMRQYNGCWDEEALAQFIGDDELAFGSQKNQKM